MVTTAQDEGLKWLYHWQAFNAERLTQTLQQHVIYCSRPSDFNDPWDCKPFYRLEDLSKPDVRQKYADWAVEICIRDGRMDAADLDRMRATLMHDVQIATRKALEINDELIKTIANEYRVYCLGTDPTNLLMWSHYASSHRGVCFEFRAADEIIGTALKCDYFAEFPEMHLFDGGEANLRPVLSKSDVWAYEAEYRIIAKEAVDGVTHEIWTTHGGLLQLAESAIESVIVGCQAPFDEIKALVNKVAPKVKLKRATMVRGRYAIEITD